MEDIEKVYIVRMLKNGEYKMVTADENTLAGIITESIQLGFTIIKVELR